MAQYKLLNKLWQLATDDQAFLQLIRGVETFVSKILSLAMVIVILVCLWDLGVYIIKELSTLTEAEGFFKSILVDLFGLFLSILIALEVLENITAYLRKHVIQLELVIATSLTAVARKIIILDLELVSGIQVIGLAIAIVALSMSYWLVRRTARDSH
jgi:uncharacterized membrane protein (DUF373 family)